MNSRPTFETSETLKNLEAAFAGESMANRKYLYFAKLAREMGAPEVAEVFEDTAGQETQHAFSHLSLIYPKDEMSVTRILEIAIEGERYEHTTMYPNFEKRALEEASAVAAHEFAGQASESREHDARFTRILELAKKKFTALARIEKVHADRYQSTLDRRKAQMHEAV